MSGHGGPAGSIITNSMLHHHNHHHNHLSLPHDDDCLDGKQSAYHLSRYRVLNDYNPPPSSSPSSSRDNNHHNHNHNVHERSWPSLRGYPVHLGIDLHTEETASMNTVTATPTKKRKLRTVTTAAAAAAAAATTATPLEPSDNEIQRSCHALQALMVKAGLIQGEDITISMPKRIRQSNPSNQTILLSPFQYDPNRNRNDPTDPYLRSYVHPSRRERCWKDGDLHGPMSEEVTEDDVAKVNANKRAWIDPFDEDDEMEVDSGKRVWSHGSEVTTRSSQESEEHTLSPMMTVRRDVRLLPRSPYTACTSSKKRRTRETDTYTTPPHQSKPSHILPEHLPWGLERDDFIISIADDSDCLDHASFSATPSPTTSILKLPADSSAPFESGTKVWPVHVDMELDAYEADNTTAPLAQTTTQCAQPAEGVEIALGKSCAAAHGADEDVRELSFLNDEEVGKINQHR
ncbi:hypothetical protein KEM54_002443 [Ascosphaera aggregata]|nr:hypothetical protein KEM54_002443 [Ascosphaera aggregata]